jgi:hypothetical protein
MTQSNAQRIALALLLGALLAGCATESSVSGDTTPVRATAAVPTAQPSASSTAAVPDRMAVPATRSGPLTGQDMPRPGVLGTGWRFRVDDGDQEDGYAGNGTPTVQRDPREVAGLAVPLGCQNRGHLPRPRWALETDYAHASTGTIGLAIRLRFRTAGDATAFLHRRAAALAACAAQTSQDGPSSVGLVQDLRNRAGLTVSTRTEAGDLHDGSAWTEIAWVAVPASDVTLVAVNAPQAVPVARRAIAGVGSIR